MKRKSLAMMLVATMLFSTMPVAHAAPKLTDIDGHWSEDAINRWTDLGVVQGSNEKFLPDDGITVAEFSTIMANLMGYTEVAEDTFDDLTGGEWYARNVLKMVAAGVLKGDGKNLNATTIMERERAMVLFGRSFDIKPTENPDLSKYSDGNQVSAWAAGMMDAMIQNGIVKGVTAETLNPKSQINRASTITVLDNAVSDYITVGGTHTLSEKGIVIIKTNEDVTLSGSAKSLIVTPGDKSTAINLDKLSVNDSIAVNSNSAKVTAKDSTLGEIVVNGSKSELMLNGSTTVKNLEASAEGVSVKMGTQAVVEKATVSAANASISGGTVKSLNINEGSGLNVGSDVAVTEVKNNTSETVTVGGKEIKPEVKPEEKPKPEVPSTGDGNGGQSFPSSSIASMRPAGPAGDVENFDYAAEYSKAGITLSGNRDYKTLTLTVDQEKLSTYLKDAENTDEIKALSNVVNGKTYLFAGVSFPVSGAKFAKVGEDVIDLSIDGVNAFNGSFVQCYAVAEKSGEEWIARSTTSMDATVSWLASKDAVPFATHEIIMQRISGAFAKNAEDLKTLLGKEEIANVQVDGTISVDEDLAVARTLTVNGTLTTNGALTVEDGGELIANGMLTTNDAVIVDGTFTVDGELIANGTLSGEGTTNGEGAILVSAEDTLIYALEESNIAKVELADDITLGTDSKKVPGAPGKEFNAQISIPSERMVELVLSGYTIDSEKKDFGILMINKGVLTIDGTAPGSAIHAGVNSDKLGSSLRCLLNFEGYLEINGGSYTGDYVVSNNTEDQVELEDAYVELNGVTINAGFAGVSTMKNGEVVIADSKITAVYYAMVNNGSVSGSKMAVNNTTITSSEDTAIYAPSGNISVWDCTIRAPRSSAIEAFAGSVLLAGNTTVEAGGEYKADISAKANDGSVMDGSALLVGYRSGYTAEQKLEIAIEDTVTLTSAFGNNIRLTQIGAFAEGKGVKDITLTYDKAAYEGKTESGKQDAFKNEITATAEGEIVVTIVDSGAEEL